MKITIKIPLVASAIILAFFFVFNSIQYTVMRDAIYATWLNNVTETSNSVSNYIGEWLNGKLNIINMMEHYIAEDYSAEQIQSVMDNPLLKKEFVLIFGALETNGKPVSNTPGWNPGATWDGRKRDWYTQARSANKAVFTPPYNDSATGRLLISAVARIMDHKKFKGAFGGDIELQTIADIINEVNFNKKGYAFLLKQNGLIVSHPDKTFNGKTIDNLFAISVPEVRDGFIETTGNEENILLKFTPLQLDNKESDLMIGVALDPEKIMEESEQLKSLSISLFLLGALITSLTLFLVMRQLLLKPLVALSKSAEEISHGNLDISIEGVEREDEIGLMAKAIHRMSMSIKFAIERLKSSS
ncbi:MAG: hypothetical protein CSB48_07105 [Proteobacteria bacterium]|nr:MAG: hypothetical protein CSB48_07105 [Pseudomonadota bacterium]PIE40147.1 MAG: hypothetical protein CSA51_01915 [Gammaproteobacteria bacterium]